MRFSTLASLAYCGPGLASIIPRQAPAAPSVTIDKGTLIGGTANNTDSFRGIPYAQPPVNDLRLRSPEPLTAPYGELQLPAQERICPQQRLTAYNTTGFPQPAIDYISRTFSRPPPGVIVSEDCLTLNIQRPASISPDAKLPVLFWIYGGGFETGSTLTYDATTLLQTSVARGQPIIYVAANYRMSAFGFLPGKELSEAGATNLGLRDQRLALEWIADNIAAFGGDPDKVTIFGESAGSASVFDHLVINGGDNTYKGRPLFRGAIMSSGTAFPTVPIDHPKPQAVYDTVVEAAGCATAADTLACLRTVPYDTLNAASSSQPDFLSYRSLDLSYLPRPDPSDNFFSQSPEDALACGNFAKVPVIISDPEDEGTLFASSTRNVTDTDAIVQYLSSYYPNAAPGVIAGLVATYPEDLAAGSPFGTGAQNELFPGFKRLAAIQGDKLFTLARRVTLERLSSLVPSWSYLGTYLYGLPVLGTAHISDVGEVFAGQPNQFVGGALQGYLLNFVNSVDPNGAGLAAWPKWECSDRKLLNISAAAAEVIEDDFRQESYEFLRDHLDGFKV